MMPQRINMNNLITLKIKEAEIKPGTEDFMRGIND